MIKFSFAVSGIFAGVKRQKDIDTWVAYQVRECLTQAIREWVTRTAQPSLHDRFGPNAYSRYGFTRRNKYYERLQTMVLGSPQPYAKPRRPKDYARLAVAITKGNALQIMRAVQQLVKGPPMRTAVFNEGSGFQIRANGRRTVSAKLTLPGARILNRVAGANGQRYRSELLDMSLGGGRDRTWIWGRVRELLHEKVWGPLAATPMMKVA